VEAENDLTNMAEPTRISFVRHGEVHNPQRVFYGRLPGFGLSDRGRRQARAAADALRHRQIAALYTSPLLRALQTARAIQALHPDLPLCVTRDLSEVYCPYDGQPHAVLDAIGWDVYSGAETPYEQPPDLLARTLRFVAAARSRHPGQHVIAATHGDVIAFLLLWAGGMAVEAQNRGNIVRLGVAGGYPAHASMTTLLYRTADMDERPAFQYETPSGSERS
jgi:broad specificity phosphatase PhoE